MCVWCDCSNSIANTLELLQSCTEPLSAVCCVCVGVACLTAALVLPRPTDWPASSMDQPCMLHTSPGYQEDSPPTPEHHTHQHHNHLRSGNNIIRSHGWHNRYWYFPVNLSDDLYTESTPGVAQWQHTPPHTGHIDTKIKWRMITIAMLHDLLPTTQRHSGFTISDFTRKPPSTVAPTIPHTADLQTHGWREPSKSWIAYINDFYTQAHAGQHNGYGLLMILSCSA